MSCLDVKGCGLVGLPANPSPRRLQFDNCKFHLEILHHQAIFNSNVNRSNLTVNLTSIGQAGPACQLGGIRGIAPAEFDAEVDGDHGIVGGPVEALGMDWRNGWRSCHV
jgi:hypothetical protein